MRVVPSPGMMRASLCVRHFGMPFLCSDDEVIEAYLDLRRRVIDLIDLIPESDATRHVPLCPEWTVVDLVSHMVGVPEDILAGRMEGVTTDAWTRAQVDRHRGDTLATLATAWKELAPDFDVVLPLIPSPVNSQMVMDAVTHEHDLRHAVGLVDAHDSSAVVVALGWALHSVEARSPGLGESLRESQVPRFELLRSLTGRRSVDQMNALGLAGEYIASLLHGSPLTPPSTAVDENR